MFNRKRVFQKMIGATLSVCLVMPSIGIAYAGSASDIEGNWANTQITKWMDQGLVSGYPDGQFKPNQLVTRAELIALINKSFGFMQTQATAFTDARSSDWYYTDLLKASAAGYIQGYADGTFRPNNKVTRQEFAVIVSNLLELASPGEGQMFQDTVASPTWSKAAIGQVSSKGIMTGYPDDTFHPEAYATRAEAIVIMDRALEFKKGLTLQSTTYDTPGSYGPDTGSAAIIPNVRITSPGVTLNNVIIDGDLVLTEGIGEGDVLLNNVTVKGIVTVQGGGKNSIRFRNAQLTSVTVDKKAGGVRLVAEGTTGIKDIQVRSGAIIQTVGEASVDTITLSAAIPQQSQISLEGNYGGVNSFASNINLSIAQGTIQKFSIDKAADRTILSNKGKIISAVLNSALKITGNGTIVKAIINATGVEIENPPGSIEAGTDVPAGIKVTIGGVTQAVGAASPTAVAVTVGSGTTNTPQLPAGPSGPGETPAPATPAPAPATPAPAPATPAPATPAPATPAPAPATPTPATPAPATTAPATPEPTLSPPTATPLPSLPPIIQPTMEPTPTPTAPNPTPVNQVNVVGSVYYADAMNTLVESGKVRLTRYNASTPFIYEDSEIYNGEFRFKLPDGMYTIYEYSTMDGMYKVQLDYVIRVINGQPEPVQIKLVIPDRNHGSIMYADGTLVENGSLTIVSGGGINFGATYWAEVVAGRFSLSLPDGSYFVRGLTTNLNSRTTFISLAHPFQIVNGYEKPSQLVITVPAQTQGTVIDTAGNPISHGKIMLHRTDSSESTVYSADVSNGKVSFNLPDGSYETDCYFFLYLKDQIPVKYTFTVDKGKIIPDPLIITVPDKDI
ncbi:S-layer homology domain-containing protein [Paenibacillus albidus]|uniref:S-layer homology domain-containing protein n=1 Tax=Paenibacillus albidus TaxID=2041023 RepID=UPI001BE83779|nr:S-layer homology domain-containing protein [Paenibacillus albidus]MBT2291684.1 S-layer homology domain-containing protein [Paenibacillus albidus]